jgi:Xaa-Pro aminopeptidase
MTYAARRQKVAELLTALDLETLVFCQPENIRYLCGFSGSDGVLIASLDRFFFLTDSRYVTQAQEEVAADAIYEYKIKSDGIIDQLQQFKATRIGGLAFDHVSELKEKGDAGWSWQPLKKDLQRLRLHKSADEIFSITAATDLHPLGLAEVESLIRPGIRESEISLALEFALRKRGAEEKAFNIIVASGERGALPHGVASDKILEEGDLVTIDFGCRVAGYHSDETITVAVGDVSDELRTVFDIVLEAHDRALAAVAPGVALTTLDKIARDYIADCGYSAYFGHGLGHGVGLEVHEAPTVSPRSTDLAEEGMVFTVEPGIYLPGVGGVRIEDMVLVTADGFRTLTKIPKTFRNILLN